MLCQKQLFASCKHKAQHCVDVCVSHLHVECKSVSVWTGKCAAVLAPSCSIHLHGTSSHRLISQRVLTQQRDALAQCINSGGKLMFLYAHSFTVFDNKSEPQTDRGREREGGRGRGGGLHIYCNLLFKSASIAIPLVFRLPASERTRELRRKEEVG